MKRYAAGIIIVLALLLVIALVFIRGRRNGSDQSNPMDTAEVIPADFAITIPIQGVLEAANSFPVVNEGRDTQLVSVLPDGTEVKVGDIIMSLTDTDVKQEVDRLQREVTEAEDNVRQQRDQSSREVENARNSLTKAEEARQLAQTQGKAGIEKSQAEVAFLQKELEVAQGQYERSQRLFGEHLLPVTEVEQAEDEVRDKQFSLEAAARTQQEAAREAEDSVALRTMEVTSARLELEKTEAAMKASVQTAQRQLANKQSDLAIATEQLAAMQVAAPASGMLLIEKIWDDGERALRTGDQVREGQRIASIIQSREMRVRCDINEGDIDLIHAGQETHIRVPALGLITLPGKVDSAGSLARQGSPWRGGTPGQKTFNAVVSLTKQDPRLRPGMGATVDVVLERVKKGLAVPVESVLSEGGKTVVYVASGKHFQRVPVKTLKRNNELMAVEGDLRVGDRVARSLPPAYLLAAGAGGAGP